MGDFIYNAPQYIDFSSPSALELKDFGDEYFDMDHEIEVEFQEMNDNQRNPSPDSTQHGDSCFQSFLEENSNTPPQTESHNVQEHHVLRRSVSAGHIVLANQVEYDQYHMEEKLSQALESLQLTGKKKKPMRAIHPEPHASKSRLTTQSTSQSATRPKMALKTRSISRDGLNRLTTYTSDKLKRKGSVDNLQPNKYISLAEAVRKFQCGTPQRFHSQTTKSQQIVQHPKIHSLTQTVPHSPMLSTKSRSRPTTYISRDELESKEADDMRKHQIKAQPVNYKILRAPVLNTKVEKKPNTQPQPFKFTEVKFQQKVAQVPESELYEFHARPAPKSTAPANRPIIKRSIIPPTVAQTPTFMRKLKTEKVATLRENPNTNKVVVKNVDLHYGGVPTAQVSQKLSRTKPEPFSFEQRDKRMQQRKEEKFQKLLEEEKKAREFHAKPIPKVVAGASKTVESKIGKLGSNGSLSSRGNDENMEPNVDQKMFKARPASVIHKKPFIPKKEERPLLEVTEFSLNTIRRAKEREEFDKMMKEKEEEKEGHKKEFDDKIKLMEQKEIAKIRKDTVHKAKPVTHYKPLEIMPSLKKITSPRSPMITKTRRHTKAL